jgi:hypothetical protein
MFAGSANAITIYGVDNLGTTNVGSVGDRVLRFDSANPTGTVVTVGSTGIANRGMSGLDFAGNGVLYSASGFNSDGTAFGGSQLFTINPNTGAGALVGNMNLPTGYSATDLSWNPVTNQMQMIAANGTANPAQLYTVNLASGAATLVGNITGLSGSLDIGLATNSAGVNYVHDIVTGSHVRAGGPGGHSDAGYDRRGHQLQPGHGDQLVGWKPVVPRSHRLQPVVLQPDPSG